VLPGALPGAVDAASVDAPLMVELDSSSSVVVVAPVTPELSVRTERLLPDIPEAARNHVLPRTSWIPFDGKSFISFCR
jgi:hypothetical protein